VTQPCLPPTGAIFRGSWSPATGCSPSSSPSVKPTIIDGPRVGSLKAPPSCRSSYPSLGAVKKSSGPHRLRLSCREGREAPCPRGYAGSILNQPISDSSQGPKCTIPTRLSEDGVAHIKWERSNSEVQKTQFQVRYEKLVGAAVLALVKAGRWCYFQKKEREHWAETKREHLEWRLLFEAYTSHSKCYVRGLNQQNCLPVHDSFASLPKYI
jgi:hypothetical protein